MHRPAGVSLRVFRRWHGGPGPSRSVGVRSSGSYNGQDFRADDPHQPHSPPLKVGKYRSQGASVLLPDRLSPAREQWSVGLGGASSTGKFLGKGFDRLGRDPPQGIDNLIADTATLRKHQQRSAQKHGQHSPGRCNSTANPQTHCRGLGGPRRFRRLCVNTLGRRAPVAGGRQFDRRCQSLVQGGAAVDVSGCLTQRHTFYKRHDRTGEQAGGEYQYPRGAVRSTANPEYDLPRRCRQTADDNAEARSLDCASPQHAPGCSSKIFQHFIRHVISPRHGVKLTSYSNVLTLCGKTRDLEFLTRLPIAQHPPGR
jgi:hypothetical protein